MGTQPDEIRQVATKLFNYLRDIMYDTENATLDLKGLADECLLLAEGMQYFGHNLKELRSFASALAKGNLSTQLPSHDNELAAPLKALHASLRHLTWQTQQVARGDYQQQVDFMGEFSQAFNSMVEQLDQRQRALQKEIETSRKKTLALEQSNSLLVGITDEIQQWIIVVDKDSGDFLFRNRAAERAMKKDEKLEEALRSYLLETENTPPASSHTREITLTFGPENETHYFSLTSYPMHWQEQSAVAQVFIDISTEKEQVQRLENYAYQDNLTGLHNRFYGMNVLSEWLDEGNAFCICFADLDNLKYVNDNFGHSEGDRYIIQAAELLEEFSPDAVVSRLGGDEFMVLVPDMTQSQAELRMQQVRDALMNRNRKSGKWYSSSVSYGVVEVQQNNTVSSGDLLSLADDRMYALKRAHKKGRNAPPPAQSSAPPEK